MSKEVIENVFIIKNNVVHSYIKEKENGVTTVTISIASEEDINEDIKKFFKLDFKGAKK